MFFALLYWPVDLLTYPEMGADSCDSFGDILCDIYFGIILKSFLVSIKWLVVIETQPP